LEQSRRAGISGSSAPSRCWLPNADLRLQSCSPTRHPGQRRRSQGRDRGIPRQDRLEDGELGNAIRAPIGVHRKTNRRYWFYEAEPSPEAQLAYLDGLKKLSESELRTFIEGMSLPKHTGQLSRRRTFRPSLPRNTGVPNPGLCSHHAQGQPKLVGKVSLLRGVGRDRSGDNLAIQIKNPRYYKCWPAARKRRFGQRLDSPYPRERRFRE